MTYDSSDEVLDVPSHELQLPKDYVVRSLLIGGTHGAALCVDTFFAYRYLMEGALVGITIVLGAAILNWFPLSYGWHWHRAAQLYQTNGDVSKFQTLKNTFMEISIVLTILFLVCLGWIPVIGGVIFFLYTFSIWGLVLMVGTIAVIFILGPIQYRHAQRLMKIRNLFV